MDTLAIRDMKYLFLKSIQKYKFKCGEFNKNLTIPKKKILSILFKKFSIQHPYPYSTEKHQTTFQFQIHSIQHKSQQQYKQKLKDTSSGIEKQKKERERIASVYTFAVSSIHISVSYHPSEYVSRT